MEGNNHTPLPDSIRVLSPQAESQEACRETTDAQREEVRLKLEAFLAQREAVAVAGRR